jgi:hypothetical protein
MNSGRLGSTPLLLASLALVLAAAAPATGDDSTELFLGHGRFRLAATWTTPQGATGPGHAQPLTDESGYFWFFDPGNVELIVKVLDACSPPFDRFWVFAAGMTNVEVELTVEDTIAGTSHTYLNPLGNPYQPVQDTSTFATCDAVRECGMGSFAEVQATPRPDRRAERAALALGGGLTAHEGDYLRVISDLKSIAELHPELADAQYNFLLVPDELIVGFEPAAYARIEAGTYDGWSCLNDWYGASGSPSTKFVEIGYALIAFEGIFDLDRVSEDYAALADVLWVGRNSIIWAGPGPPPPITMCAAAAGDTFRYFYSDYFFRTGAAAWYFTSTPDSPPTLVEAYSGIGPLPDWWDDAQTCQRE